LLEHCGDCVDGLSFQTLEPHSSLDWPALVRRWAKDVGASPGFEVWETRWKPAAPGGKNVVLEELTAAARRQVPRGLTGILHANVFGAARGDPPKGPVLLRFAADPDCPRQLSDRFLGASRLYPGWRAFNRTLAAPVG
jgi:hypothetical protein